MSGTASPARTGDPQIHNLSKQVDVSRPVAPHILQVSPRRRGEQELTGGFVWGWDGSSPPARGTGWSSTRRSGRCRFIPAGAGNSGHGQLAAPVPAVHPRRCGEQVSRTAPVVPLAGSSPQVRGTATHHENQRYFDRFIPAGAGNSCPRMMSEIPVTVHPRRCGEQPIAPSTAGRTIGSSPQVRGTAFRLEAGAAHFRFIPAGAGNRYCSAASRAPRAVHPRRCGEQRHCYRVEYCQRGSSPQVRGTEKQHRMEMAPPRFIPAGAGNRTPRSARHPRPSVHPRRRGEQPDRKCYGVRSCGSSPQARGTGKSARNDTGAARFIPAGAGNRVWRDTHFRPHTVHPRRRGEQNLWSGGGRVMAGSSPQARGTDHHVGMRKKRRRFIPAGAGNRPGRPETLTDLAVHPRRRGEQIAMSIGHHMIAGSSPQARGTGERIEAVFLGRRFIPAGAGNSACGPG